jgi:hypothetical protein
VPVRQSLERRRSLEELLGSLESQRIHHLRGIEVLEVTNTTEARQLLEALARDTADAWLAREAKAALERLARGPAANR